MACYSKRYFCDNNIIIHYYLWSIQFTRPFYFHHIHLRQVGALQFSLRAGHTLSRYFMCRFLYQQLARVNPTSSAHKYIYTHMHAHTYIGRLTLLPGFVTRGLILWANGTFPSTRNRCIRLSVVHFFPDPVMYFTGMYHGNV